MQINVKPLFFGCGKCGARIDGRHLIYLGITHTSELYLEGVCPKCRKTNTFQFPLEVLAMACQSMPSPTSGISANDLKFLNDCHVSVQKEDL